MRTQSPYLNAHVVVLICRADTGTSVALSVDKR